MPEVLTALTLLGVVLMIVQLSISAARTAAKLDVVHYKMDVLLKQAGVDLQEIMRRELEPHLRVGNKIEAIKIYRIYTGVGLAEAKAAVEKMQESA
jgi:ribosomal protein L7/L12